MATLYWIEKLEQHLRGSNQVAMRAEREAREAARTLATESEQRDDSRAALEFSALSSGQSVRACAAQEDLRTLIRFRSAGLPTFGARTPIAMGAIVDVASESDAGSEERTFIVLPVGAGTELTGPGGDGFLTVITPNSPVGKALLGRTVGEVVDVVLRGEPQEWAVVDVC